MATHKTMMKRTLVTLLLFGVGLLLHAQGFVFTGQCGANLSYAFDANSKVLKITGTGEMDNYSSGSSPWYSQRKNIVRVELPDGLTNIGSYAFRDCLNLTDINIPTTVRKIGENAFGYCSSLTSVAVPDGVTNISGWTFFYCSSLTSVTLPPTLTNIGRNAFYGCSSLADVALPQSLLTIEDGAFEYCTSMTSIELPKSLTAMGSWVFAGSTSLTDVYCYAESVVKAGFNVFNSTNVAAGTLYIPSSLVSQYRSTSAWKGFRSYAACMEQCATPVVGSRNGRLTFRSATPDAKFHYVLTPYGEALEEAEGVTPDDVVLPYMVMVKVYATATGYRPSDVVTVRLTMQPPVLRGDMDDDGRLTIGDVTRLVEEVKQ